MKRFYVILVISFFIFQYTYSQWEQIEGVTSENLYDIYFVNESTGWIVGQNTILKTVDGGENWNAQSPPVTDTRYYGVFFKDELNGWAVGKKGTASTAGRVHYTTDGGENWLVYNTGGSLPWWSVSFADNNNGVIVGQEGQILYTSDGGGIWNTRSNPSGNAGSSYEVNLLSSGNGMTVGASSPTVGHIIKTANSGNGWNLTDGNVNGGLYGLAFVNDILAYAVGSGGLIIKTIDGGANWSEQTSNTTNRLEDIHFKNETKGIAVGFSGSLLTTNDGGESWQDESIVTTTLRSAHINGNTSWAVGTLGTILKYKEPIKVINVDYQINEYELDIDDLSIATDGSSATIFEYSGDDYQDVYLKIAEDTNENTDLYGSFEEGIVINNTFTTTFNHPKYFNLENQQYREVHLQLIHKQTLAIVAEYPIKFVRPSLLMVHGIWAGPDSFRDMEEYLLAAGMYENYQIHKAAYINDISNTENILAFISDKEHLINFWTLPNNISIGKIDVIGHSNGGLLSRYYIQGSVLDYEQDINKLITLNTPHSGSQMANRLLTTFSFAQPALTIMGKNANNGIIDNLKVDGTFIEQLNSNIQNYDKIGVHSISSTLSVSELINFDLTRWDITLGLIVYYHLNALNENFNNYIFNGFSNDIIVPVNSQIGGSSATTPFTNQIHMGSTENDLIKSRTETLLNSKPSDISLFSNNGFSPETITYNPDDSRISSTQESTETITINSPISGTEYQAGTEVSIISTGSSNINNILTSMGNSTVSIQNHIEENNSISTNSFVIPENAIGRLDIIAVGFDDSGYAAYESTYINVTTNAVLESIRIINEELSVYQGYRQVFRLVGRFNDGIERDITNASDILYSFVNDNAEIQGNGIIMGLTEGEDVLTASYMGLEISAPISILNSDSLSLFENTQSIKNEIIIYPNPFSNNLNITSNQPIDLIEIYDMLGKKLLTTKEYENIDLSALDNGIYLINIKINSSIITKRVIKR